MQDFDTSAERMSAEQVFRAAILKRTECYIFDELTFHIVDSACYCRFCRIGFAHNGFKKLGFCKKSKALSAETWEVITWTPVACRQEKQIEKGHQDRRESIAVSSPIHEYIDSTSLWDSVRDLTLIIGKARKQCSIVCVPYYQSHQKIQENDNCWDGHKNKKIRKDHYRDLLKVTYKTLCYSRHYSNSLRNMSARI